MKHREEVCARSWYFVHGQKLSSASRSAYCLMWRVETLSATVHTRFLAECVTMVDEVRTGGTGKSEACTMDG